MLDDGYLVVDRLFGGSSVTGLLVQGGSNPILGIRKPKDEDIRAEAKLMIPETGLLLGMLHDRYLLATCVRLYQFT